MSTRGGPYLSLRQELLNIWSGGAIALTLREIARGEAITERKVKRDAVLMNGYPFRAFIMRLPTPIKRTVLRSSMVTAVRECLELAVIRGSIMLFKVYLK
jgi:hypothetical protein